MKVRQSAVLSSDAQIKEASLLGTPLYTLRYVLISVMVFSSVVSPVISTVIPVVMLCIVAVIVPVITAVGVMIPTPIVATVIISSAILFRIATVTSVAVVVPAPGVFIFMDPVVFPDIITIMINHKSWLIIPKKEGQVVDRNPYPAPVIYIMMCRKIQVYVGGGIIIKSLSGSSDHHIQVKELGIHSGG